MGHGTLCAALVQIAWARGATRCMPAHQECPLYVLLGKRFVPCDWVLLTQSDNAAHAHSAQPFPSP